MTCTRRLSPGRRLKMAGVLALAVVLPAALSGCVNQGEYDDLYSTNRALEERNVQLRQELEEQESTIGLLRDRIASGDEALRETQRRNAELNDSIVRLRENYRNLSERLDSASVAMLDPATDRALRELAARNPNLMSFDSERGLLQFASDLTFGSGSADVQASARERLREFARILQDADAANYELRVVGHTDNVRVSRAETKAKHPTNMHLSVHRAISVRDVLTGAGISSERVQVAGWGPHRPAVPNPSSGGAAPNRRVEIFILASDYNGPSGGGGERAPAQEAPTPQEQRDPSTIK